MIDFSRYVGWAIPEGNVVQVSDAGGRVLWSTAAGSFKTFYLRPAEDISVDGEIVPTPAGIAAAYMLIDEEVTDAAATTIGVAASAENTDVLGTVKFRMGGSVPENVEKVTNIHFVVSAMVSGANDVASEYYGSTANVGTEITVDGTSHRWRPIGHLESAVADDYVNANFDPRECETHNKQKILDVINAALSETGELPDIVLEVELSAWEYTASSNNKGNATMDYGYAKMSQAYIALDYKPKGGDVS